MRINKRPILTRLTAALLGLLICAGAFSGCAGSFGSPESRANNAGGHEAADSLGFSFPHSGGSMVTPLSSTRSTDSSSTDSEYLTAESLEWLNEHGDTSKVYLLPDGFLYKYTEILTSVKLPNDNVLFDDEEIPDEKDLAVGYTNKTRINKDGLIQGGQVCFGITGYIPVKGTDRIRVDNYPGGYFTVYMALYANTDGNVTPCIGQKLILTERNGTLTSYQQDWCTRLGDYSFETKSTIAQTFGVDPDGEYYVVISSGNFFDGDEAVYRNYDKDGVTVVEPTATYEWKVYSSLNESGLSATVAELQDALVALQNRVAILEALVGVGSGGDHGGMSEEEKLSRIIAWDKPIYDDLEPYILDHTLRADPAMIKTWTSATDPNNKYAKEQIQMVYDEYNTLCEDYPQFVRDITDEYGGPCSDGELMVRVYEFCEYDGRQYNEGHTMASETKPTIIISAGIHKEWGGLISMTKAMVEITTNPDLQYLRRNCRFIVVPLLNPYCFLGYNIAEHRYNANGVELHKAFGDKLTEVECLYLDKIFRDYSDAALYVSCHSAQQDSTWGVGFVWASASSNYTCNLGFRLIDLMSWGWEQEYTGEVWQNAVTNANRNTDTCHYVGTQYDDKVFTALAPGDYRVGHAAISKTENSEYKHALKYGIQGVNVEVVDTFWVLSGRRLDPYVISHGAEVYINLFRLALESYDVNDKTAQYE